MPSLHISDRRERLVVGTADRLLGVAETIARPFRRRRRPRDPRRILLLRLERIGDLLMTLPALADLRALAPSAEIVLAVGSWNEELASIIPAIDTVQCMDAAWLARDRAGRPLLPLISAAARWRARRYDLAINFEPDIRSNLLLAAAGAAWTAGYSTGGGGPLLDQPLPYDVRAHTTDNARRLVAAVFGRAAPDRDGPLLAIPETVSRAAGARLAARSGPLVGLHASGGRPVKQWDPDRFADVARRLIAMRGATIVLTGEAGDRPLVNRVKSSLPPSHVLDLVGQADLLLLAAVLERLDLFVTGDTGPMHLAAAVGTPVVAVFGPSDPNRYAPRTAHDRIVRVDLPCSPCNRIRSPPARCVGHTPDCLAFVPVERVLDAALSLLDDYSTRARAAGGRHSGA